MKTRGRNDSAAKATRAEAVEARGRPWDWAAGGVLGIALLKFGNPVILDHFVPVPSSGSEWIFQGWPVRLGYALSLLAGLALIWRRGVPRVPRWVLVAFVAWFAVQWVSSARSIKPEVSAAMLPYFGVCALWFGAGLFGVRQVEDGRIWGPLLAGMGIVLWFGFDQHYGGLAAAREMVYQQPNWQELPPDYLKKVSSDRIFSTLFYPNALATVLLLLTPALGRWLWGRTAAWPRVGRLLATLLFFYMAGAAMLWSGSKAGWLVALGLVGIVILHQPFSQRLKAGLVAVVVAGGLIAFFVKFAGYFAGGATSVAARFDYWNAAVTGFSRRPLLGTGPGTFQTVYQEVKPPEAEMARLTHNDYLQQASDSGLVGFVAWAIFVLGGLGWVWWRVRLRPREMEFAIWLGLVGWAAHSAVEFPLYLPALAWPFLFLYGLLLAWVGMDRRKVEA